MKTLQNNSDYTTSWCFINSHPREAHPFNFTTFSSSKLQSALFNLVLSGPWKHIVSVKMCDDTGRWKCTVTTQRQNPPVRPALKPHSTIQAGGPWGAAEHSGPQQAP